MKPLLSRQPKAGARSRVLATLAALSLVVLSPPQRVFAADFPVHEGEDLLSALKRLKPCLRSDAVLITPEVLATNPERSDGQGKMILRNLRLKLPDSYIDPRTSCDGATAPPISHAHAAEPIHNLPPTEPSHESMLLVPHVNEGDENDEEDDEEEDNKSEAHPATHAQSHETHESHEAEHSEHSEHSELRNKLSISGTLTYARLDAALTAPVAAQTSHLSKKQPGFEIEYEHEFSEKWAMGLNYGYTNTSYQDRDDIVFVEPTVALHELGATLIRTLGESTHLAVSVGVEQIDELSVDQFTTETIDHTVRPVAGLQLLQEVGHVLGLAVEAKLGAQLFLPTTSAQQLGLGEHLVFELEREITHHWSIRMSGGIYLERQATQAESHSLTYVKGSLGFGYRF